MKPSDVKTEDDVRLLNLSTALALGMITWDQYFELVIYGEIKVAAPLKAA